MIYINKDKKRVVGRNNQVIPPLVMDYSTIETLYFQLIDDNNKIQDIPSGTSGLYFAGSLKIGPDEDLLFLSNDVTVEDNSFKAEVDTYTETWLKDIKKKWTEINIELGIASDDVKQVILRDIAYACPRVYVSGSVPTPPAPPSPGGDYYTKAEVNNIVSGIQNEIDELDDKTTQAWTTISAASSDVELADGNWLHNPVATPTYILPNVNDSLVHEIVLDVKFANVISLSFENASGVILPMLSECAPTVGSTWRFLCTYSPLQTAWKIMPISLENA